MAKNSKQNCEPCTNPEPFPCPPFNQRTAQKFVEDLQAMDSDERQVILDELKSEGIVQFIFNRFSVSDMWKKTLLAAPASTMESLQCSLLIGIPNNWDFEFTLADVINPTSFRCKQKETTISGSTSTNPQGQTTVNASISKKFGAE